MSTNERPNRLVVGLGIATIVLFSANLLAMLSQRVWPQIHDALFESEAQVEEAIPAEFIEETVPEVVISTVAPRIVIGETLHFTHPTSRHTVFRFQRRSSSHERRRHRHHYRLHTDIGNRDDLDLDLQKLERSIEREMEKLNGDMESMKTTLSRAMNFRIHLDGLENITIHKKLDLSELEEQLESIAETFEVRLRMHESDETGASSKVHLKGALIKLQDMIPVLLDRSRSSTRRQTKN